MKRLTLLALCCALADCAIAQTMPPPQNVVVKQNVFQSAGEPKIQVTLDPRFKYLGKFPFDILGIAGGYRYVWGEFDHGKHLKRTFVIQMEGYYASNKNVYDYPMSRPVKLGSNDYQHGAWVYDNDDSIKERPGNESDLLKQFMQQKGYKWEHELIMSRFGRIVDAGKKNEIIFFYFENLKDHTQKPTGFFPDGGNAPGQKQIEAKVDADSRNAFSVKD